MSDHDASRRSRQVEHLTRDSSPAAHDRVTLTGLLRYYRSIAALALVGGLMALFVAALLPERYAATATMFASTPLGDGSRALQADEFTQRRVQSYVGVLESEAMAQAILADTDMDLSAEEISQRIDVSAPADTVLMEVTVLDESPTDALDIAGALTEIATEEVQRVDAAAEVDLVPLSAPRVSDEPVSPRTALITVVGLIFGAGLGVAQAVLRHQAARDARQGPRAGAWSALRVIAVVPFEPEATRRPVQPYLQTGSAWSESFRHLRAAIPPHQPWEGSHVVLVVGAATGVGTTTTAMHYANAAAAWGHRVLLVDADLRGRGLEHYLDLDPGRGLTQALQRLHPGDGGAALGLVQRWGGYGLDVMMRGPLPDGAPDLLGAGRVTEFLKVVRKQFHLIVIDCSPAVEFADAASLAPHVDEVVLVVRDGDAADRRVDRAVEVLEGVGAPLAGVVLTMQQNDDATAVRHTSRK